MDGSVLELMDLYSRSILFPLQGGKMEGIEFQGFPKIHRLSRPCILTEKIDGTNGQIHILEDGRVLAASRSQYITPEKDNFGFARWVKEHEEELREGLGFGRHYGEWWGKGIQRGYGLKERRFSLFNVSRWAEVGSTIGEGQSFAPGCCHVVPTLWVGQFSTALVEHMVEALRQAGSVASPGFMKPEGVVVLHVKSGHLYKKTLEKDDVGKE